jgi:CsoR family transcriptional regulator, copper-sensing transcriptional repressor
MTEASPSSFPDHRKQLHRVARIKGQLDGVVRMIEAQRYCVDILTQTAAIRAALKSLEASILEKHIDTCVRQALVTNEGAEEKIQELLRLYKNV